MSGFDNDKVDAEFLRGRGWRSNFLVNLGHGDPGACSPARRGSTSRRPASSFDLSLDGRR